MVVCYEYETMAKERKMNKSGSDDTIMADNSAARTFASENSQVELNQEVFVLRSVISTRHSSQVEAVFLCVFFSLSLSSPRHDQR